MSILTILCEGGKRLSRADAVAAFVCGEVFFRLSATKFTRDALEDVNGNDFCHDSRFFLLVNGSKMGVVFLRNDIGIPSESLSAKMERVLASLRVQSYNTKKGIPNFSQFYGVSKC